jgi:lipid II:glycine glycyltransferase (peptidoglycan interpeptide bridge formation enzyme)
MEAGSSPFSRNWTSLGPTRVSLRLDLSPSDAEIFAGFRKVTRYEIRRAEKLGLGIAASTSSQQDDQFLDLYFRVAARKGFAPDPRNFMRKILAWLRSEPDRGVLLVVEHDGNLIAGAVVLRAGRRCWYVWGANEEQKDFSAGHLLQWQAIHWAKSQGCTEYDFGGYTPGAKSGPAWFKEGFGGKVVHFVAPHRLVLREGQYRLLRLANQAKAKLQRARGA